MSENLPIVLVEVVLIFGGVLAFAWWQLHEIKVDQRKAAAQRQAREAQEAQAAREPPRQSATAHATTEAAASAQTLPPADAP